MKINSNETLTSARRGMRAFAAARGFTLIELILVMTILTIAVSITAPALAHFFRGRTLDSEARRLLALSREAQSRAVSEGVPVELWLDAAQKKYGLEAEPSYEPTDPKAIAFDFEAQLELQVVNSTAGNLAAETTSESGANVIQSNHRGLPRMRYMPDGSISETSPRALEFVGRDGDAVWVALARNRLNYEIRARNN